MGATSPNNGAVAIAAVYVIQDLLNAQTSNAKLHELPNASESPFPTFPVSR